MGDDKEVRRHAYEARYTMDAGRVVAGQINKRGGRLEGDHARRTLRNGLVRTDRASCESAGRL